MAVFDDEEKSDRVECINSRMRRRVRRETRVSSVFTGVRLCVIALVVSLVVEMSRGACGAEVREDAYSGDDDVDDGSGSGDEDTSRVFTPLTESFSLYHSSAEV